MKRSKTDMSKFKVGDSVRIDETYYQTYAELKGDVYERGEVTRDDIDELVVVNFNGKKMCCSPAHLVTVMLAPELNIVDTPQKDLTTLDVPFGELDRDTQLRLVNHVLGGDETEVCQDTSWRVRNITGNLYFTLALKYRAVAKQPEQPTERETLESKLHEQWVELNATMKRITEIK